MKLADVHTCACCEQGHPCYLAWDNTDQWVDEPQMTYAELKEQAERRMLDSMSEAEALQSFKLLRYVEHRAMREHGYVV